MNVERIRDLRGLRGLEQGWRRVYEADPTATVFQSWPWLSAWLSASSNPWTVLALREAGEYAGFLALSRKTSRGRFGVLQDALYLAGHPISNHTGLLCLPDQEPPVLAALSGALGRESWRTLSLELVSDPRIAQLACALRGAGVTLKRAPDSDSPYLTLPGSFEDYLAAHFPGKAGRELRRRERKAEALGLRYSQATTGDLERHLHAFYAVHEQRFGAIAPRHERLYRAIFGAMLAEGALHFEVLWDGEKPAAAQIAFLDRKHGVYHGCQGGWDAEYGELAPGLLLKLSAIRYALDTGFDSVDFGRGAHDYKAALGATSSYTERLRLGRLGLRAQLTGLAGRLRA